MHFQDGNFCLRARRDIAVGDEVCITYLSEDDLMQSAMVRREALESTKHFVCMCDRCNVETDYTRGMLCPVCKNDFVFLPAQPCKEGQEQVEWCKLAVPRCGCTLEIAQVHALWKYESQVQARIDKMEQGLENYSFSKVYTEDAKSWCANVFNRMKFHWLGDKLANMLSTQFAHRRRYKEAIECLLIRKRYLMHAYPELNGALAWCQEELGDVYGKEDPEKAAPEYEKACATLLLLFGDQHEYYVEPLSKLNKLREEKLANGNDADMESNHPDA